MERDYSDSDTYKNHFIEDIMGNSLVVDFNKRGNFCYVEIEPLSFTTFKKGKNSSQIKMTIVTNMS